MKKSEQATRKMGGRKKIKVGETWHEELIRVKAGGRRQVKNRRQMGA